MMVLGVAACGSSSGDDTAATPTETGTEAATDGPQVITVDLASAAQNASPRSVDIEVSEEIRATLPKDVLDSGKLVVGGGFLPSGFPPLGYLGTDTKTWTGSEPDMARMVSAVFGLELDWQPVTFENLFIRLLSGEYDAAISNVSVTEARKEQGMDFASYRIDTSAFEVLESSDWNFEGVESLAGKTVATKPGTNQAAALDAWQQELRAMGKDFEIRYFGDLTGSYLALDSGRIDAYYSSVPSIADHIAKTADSPRPTRFAGVASTAPEGLELLVGATTAKDNGLVQPLSDAINYLIEGGQYEQWIETYNLGPVAIEKSEVNPPGLPIPKDS